MESLTRPHTPLAIRFPAAHQFFRMRLLDEIFPIAPAVACNARCIETDRWDVELAWPALGFAAREGFTAAELRAVYGRWSDWARSQVFAITGLLPV